MRAKKGTAGSRVGVTPHASICPLDAKRVVAVEGTNRQPGAACKFKFRLSTSSHPSQSSVVYLEGRELFLPGHFGLIFNGRVETSIASRTRRPSATRVANKNTGSRSCTARSVPPRRPPTFLTGSFGTHWVWGGRDAFVTHAVHRAQVKVK